MDLNNSIGSDPLLHTQTINQYDSSTGMARQILTHVQLTSHWDKMTVKQYAYIHFIQGILSNPDGTVMSEQEVIEKAHKLLYLSG